MSALRVSDAPPPGARVRVLPNDADVEPGTEGIVVRIHEASGFPVVRLEPGNRAVAFLPTQLTILAPPPPEASPMPTNGKTALVEALDGVSTERRSLADQYDWDLHDPRSHEVTFTRASLRLSLSAGRCLPTSCTRVELLYDAQRGAVGIHPTTDDAPLGVAIKRGEKGITIPCPTFTARLRLPAGRGPGSLLKRSAIWDANHKTLVVENVPFGNGSSK